MWQPIETAPKDGREVLTYSHMEGAFVAFWYDMWKDKGEWIWTTHDLGGDETITPDFWMPLPPPPDA